MVKPNYKLKQHTVKLDTDDHSIVCNEMREEIFTTGDYAAADEIANLRTQLHYALDALHAIAHNQEVAWYLQNDDDPYVDKPRIDQIEDIADTVHALICTNI